MGSDVYCVYFYDKNGEPEVLETYSSFSEAMKEAYSWQAKRPNVAINYGRVAALR